MIAGHNKIRPVNITLFGKSGLHEIMQGTDHAEDPNSSTL